MMERSAVPAVVFVLFPSLETRGPATIREIAAHLQERGHAAWVADEADHERRLKALYIREIYDVGRGASIVMTNSDGVWLDGWYDEARLPTIDELITEASRHVREGACGSGGTMSNEAPHLAGIPTSLLLLDVIACGCDRLDSTQLCERCRDKWEEIDRRIPPRTS